MQRFESPFDEDFGHNNEQESSSDKLGDVYAAKALARLDEIFRNQEEIESQYSSDPDRIARAEERARQEASSGDYEERMVAHLGRYEDPDAKSVDDLSEDEKEAFAEIAKGLSDLGIKPLDSDSSSGLFI